MRSESALIRSPGCTRSPRPTGAGRKAVVRKPARSAHDGSATLVGESAIPLEQFFERLDVRLCRGRSAAPWVYACSTSANAPSGSVRYPRHRSSFSAVDRDSHTDEAASLATVAKSGGGSGGGSSSANPRAPNMTPVMPASAKRRNLLAFMNYHSLPRRAFWRPWPHLEAASSNQKACARNNAYVPRVGQS